MSKSSTVYVCQNCGESFARWQGQCGQCSQWNTLVEELKPSSAPSHTQQKTKKADSDAVVAFSRVEESVPASARLSTGIGELDRVLGGSGGMVPGAVMLVGGEPGIGKSTLLTQVVINLLVRKLDKGKNPKPILYISGEESPSQISLRIKRIIKNEHKNKKGSSGKSGDQSLGDHLLFVTSTDVDVIGTLLGEHHPQLVIVDSIQTMTTDDLGGAAGSVGQIRESTERLTQAAKRHNIPTFLVGHVTKDGNIAGPKVLEHIVDTVLELSGERTSDLRLLRAIKNRFGATDEVGVFRFIEQGLEEVTNPSALFLEHSEANVPGSATVCVMEGTRPILAEVQALVVESQLAMPRRVGRGIELSRIQVLSAVLQKHCRLPLGSSDIFLSAAGGFQIREPAVDLGLAVAMASSLKNKALPQQTVFIGEVGLLGEVRKVQFLDRRIKEAKRLGFKNIISRESHKKVWEVLKEFGLG